MLTKKLKFEDDVLEVISQMEWENDGTLGKLTGGQLDRKMYVSVNKALEAMGGKWNRKLGGHIFQSDPRESVEGLLSDGVLEIERDGFFETPETVIDRMLELNPLDNDYKNQTLEPSAGIGAIAKRLVMKYSIKSGLILVEKNSERCQKLKGDYPVVYNVDFLTYDNSEKYNFTRIYMNPPFENLQDIDHIKHAYDLLAKNGTMVSVMAESAFFREDKKSIEFREWLDNVNGISEKLPEGSFKTSGTMVNTRLVLIKK